MLSYTISVFICVMMCGRCFSEMPAPSSLATRLSAQEGRHMGRGLLPRLRLHLERVE